MPFHLLTDPARWRKARADYIRAARGCKAALTHPDGPWNYDPEDDRVKAAVASWVDRARNAHAIALGRKPLTTNFLAVTDDAVYQGSLYATNN